MNFIRKIIHSIYSPPFYRTIPSQSLGSSLLYFFLLILIIVAVTVSTLAAPLVTGINGFLNEGSKQVISEYPDELRVTIKNGKVRTNVQEPNFISLPESWKTEGSDTANLLVIDTHTPFSQEQFETYNSLGWLTKDSLFIKSDSQTRANDLSEVEDFVLDKQKIRGLMAKVSPWFAFIAPLAVFLLFVVFFIAKTFTLAYLFLLAFVFWIFTKLFSLKISYGDVYKIGIYAVTLGLIIETLVGVTRPLVQIPTIPFMFSIISLGVFSANILFHKNLWGINEDTAKTSNKASK